MGNVLDPVRQHLLDTLLSRGLDMAEVSKAIGKNPTYVQQFIRYNKPFRLPEEPRLKLAAFLDIDEKSLRHPIKGIIGRTGLLISDPPDVELGGISDFPNLGPRDVPVMQLVTGGDEADFTFSDQPIDHVRRPFGLIGQKVIAAFVTGESMSPRYDPGDPVYAYISRPAIPGDFVIIEMQPRSEGEDRRGYIKRLKRITSSLVICEQYNPKKEVEYFLSEVKRIYKIVPQIELLGL